MRQEAGRPGTDAVKADKAMAIETEQKIPIVYIENLQSEKMFSWQVHRPTRAMASISFSITATHYQLIVQS